MAAYRRVDDPKPLVGWLPVHRDQLWAQRSVTSMGELTFLYEKLHICIYDRQILSVTDLHPH